MLKWHALIRTPKHKGVQHRSMLDSLCDIMTGEQNLRTGNRNLTVGGGGAFFSPLCPERESGIAQSVYGPGYGMYDPGLVSGRVQQRLFSSSHRPNGLRDPPNLLFNGCLASFPGVKLAGRDFDHAPPCRAEVKNEWMYTSALPIQFHGLEREKCAFYLLQDRL
jgi:hypothetical protein